MGGGAGVLEASALVDGDVHQRAARPHGLDRLARDQARGARPGHEDRADDQIRLGAGARHVEFGGEAGADGSAVDLLDAAHALGVDVEDGDVRPHARGHPRRRQAGGPAAQDDDVPAPHSGGPAQQDPGPAVGAQQGVRTHLGGQPAGDLGHGRQQRQGAGGGRHGLVGDGGDPLGDELLGQGPVRGQVEVGEQEQIGAQEGVLLGDRLLDLEHHLGVGPQGGHVVGDGGAGGDVVVIGDGGTHAGTRLNGHGVPAPGERVDAGGRDGDAELVVLDLGGNTDSHGSTSVAGLVCDG